MCACAEQKGHFINEAMRWWKGRFASVELVSAAKGILLMMTTLGRSLWLCLGALWRGYLSRSRDIAVMAVTPVLMAGA